MTIKGTLMGDGWDEDREARVKCKLTNREDYPGAWWFSPEFITLLPEPIEVGDVVKGGLFDMKA